MFKTVVINFETHKKFAQKDFEENGKQEYQQLLEHDLSCLCGLWWLCLHFATKFVYKQKHVEATLGKTLMSLHMRKWVFSPTLTC